MDLRKKKNSFKAYKYLRAVIRIQIFNFFYGSGLCHRCGFDQNYSDLTISESAIFLFITYNFLAFFSFFNTIFSIFFMLKSDQDIVFRSRSLLSLFSGSGSYQNNPDPTGSRIEGKTYSLVLCALCRLGGRRTRLCRRDVWAAPVTKHIK